MATMLTLNAQFRSDLGKGASRRLRREGLVPAILYGGKDEPRMLNLKVNELNKQLENEQFYSSVIVIKVDDKEQEAIMKDIQRHPAKRTVSHIDFQRIVKGQKIKVTVQLHLVGEETAPGVKLSGGIVSRLRTELEISCLPRDIPEFLTLDMSELDLDQSLMLSNITVPEGVELTDLAQGLEYDQPVVSIIKPKEEIIEDTAPEAPETEDGEAAAAEGDGAEAKPEDGAEKDG